MDMGFVRLGVGIPKVSVADCGANLREIKSVTARAAEAGVQVLVLPELAITGYTPGDLFLQSALLRGAEEALGELLRATRGVSMLIAVGLPVKAGARVFNAAALLADGRLLGVVPKTYLPNYGEFYEKRWFAPAGECRLTEITLAGHTVPFGTDLLFTCRERPNLTVGVEICEDLWAVIPPSSRLSLAGATVLLNLSASNELTGKGDYRHSLISGQSARTFSIYAYAGAGMGESTTDTVFSGHGLVAENGRILLETEKFRPEGQMACCDADVELVEKERMRCRSFGQLPEDTGVTCRVIPFSLEGAPRPLERRVDPRPFVPGDQDSRDRRCREIFAIQTAGLRKRLEATGSGRAVIGVSGGLDSTLALLTVVNTFDSMGRSHRDILGVTMPGFGTTDRTYENAVSLMRALGISWREIPIGPACEQHFQAIGHDPVVRDATYENTQARERTQVLMDLANQEGGIVIGTGDLSEIALGWSTYNGDHMSMYAVNCGIPKTLIRSLVQWAAGAGIVDGGAPEILLDVAATPVSPELLPPDGAGRIEQRTEDIVGPYVLHDFFLYYVVRYGFRPAKVALLAEHAFSGEFDRAEIVQWLEVFYRRFFSQQFKRSCMPDGPKVGTVALSPRGDWRMPSDASAALWLDEVARLRAESR